MIILRHKFYFFLIIFSLLLSLSSSCLYKRPPMGMIKRVTIPTVTEGEMKGFKVREFCEAFVKMGWYEDINQVEGLPFVFTLKDSLGNAVPGGSLILKFEEGALWIHSDAEGKVTLRFEHGIIEKNPAVFAQRDGIPLFPELHISYEWELGEKKKPSIISLSDLRMIKVGKDLIYYPEGYEEMAAQIAEYLPRERSVIEKSIGINPILWGEVLTDLEKPAYLPESEIFLEGSKFNLFAFSIPDGSSKTWLLLNVHEWTETTISRQIKFGDDKVRWVKDGLAEYARITFLRSLSRDELDNLGLTPLLEEEFTNYEKYLDEMLAKGEKELKFDVFNWSLVSPEHPATEMDVAGYGLSLYLWLNVEERFGSSTITAFVKQMQEMEKPKGAELVLLLSELTGEDIQKIFKTFKIGELKKFIPELKEMIGI